MVGLHDNSNEEDTRDGRSGGVVGRQRSSGLCAPVKSYTEGVKAMSVPICMCEECGASTTLGRGARHVPRRDRQATL
jgi:hypothetical protein